jgi:molybdopterin-binding protein
MSIDRKATETRGSKRASQEISYLHRFLRLHLACQRSKPVECPLVTTYRVGQVAELLGVSTDTVRRWADSGRLTMRRRDRGQRMIDGADLARFLTETPRPAEPELSATESARNRFPGVVTKVEKDGLVAIVHVQTGPHRVVSLMTREAADELGLEPGDLAVAVVKATNVVVEAPRSE